MPHHQIRPVERDCICPTRPPLAGHSANCEAAFREKFFGSWRRERERFYGLWSSVSPGHETTVPD